MIKNLATKYGLPITLAIVLIATMLFTGIKSPMLSKSRIVIGPSIVEAASPTPDYTCDGTADNVQIQQALDAITSGGELVFLPGTYNLAATLSRAVNNITIVGAGLSTLFAYDGSHATWSVGSQTGWVFRDLATDAGGITNYANAELQNVQLGSTYVGYQSANATVTSLTSGRVPIVSTGGLLTDDSGLTYNSGTDTLTTGSISLTCVSPPTIANMNAITISYGSGVLTGTYYYAVTYLTATGETGWTTTLKSATPSSQQVLLGNIPVSSDSRVTGRKIYRTTAAGASDNLANLFLLTTINNNIDTTYTDNTADGSLGVTAPGFNTTGGTINYQGNSILGLNENYSLVLGLGSNAQNTGWGNIGFGSGSFNSNTNGNRNNFFGDLSLVANTTGSANICVGTHTMQYSTTGSSNTAVGHAAMQGAEGYTSDNQSVAVGYYSMQNSQGADQNTAVGFYSLRNSTGVYNTAVGYNSLIALTSGTSNTALGSNTGATITASGSNTLIGSSALRYGSTGSSYNAIVGSLALGYSGDAGKTQANNSALGYGAGYMNYGSSGIFIGYMSGYYERSNTAGMFFLDALDRGDLAGGKAKSLMYGNMKAKPATGSIYSAGQFLTVNGGLNIGDVYGQQVNFGTLTELTTIANSAYTDTTIKMPANSIILGVDVRVTTAITGTSTFTVGDAGNASRFNTASVSKAVNSTDSGTKAGAYYNASAASIRITPDTTPSDSTGIVRVTIHYYTITPATS